MDENFLRNVLVDIIKQTWWIILLGLLIYLAIELFPVVLKRVRSNKKFSAIGKIQSDKEILSKLRGLKPKEFEDYISFLFSKLGFKTESLGGPYDGGIDVIAEKDGVKHFIQCKKFITSQVSVGAVRDFYGALVDKLSNGKGYFITTNKFTLEAEKFAETKPIELIDGYGLMKYIKMSEIDNEEYFKKETEKCPKCGSDLVKREGKYGDFFGCSSFPKCRFTKK